MKRLLYFSVITFFVYGCATKPTKERGQLEQLVNCAEKEGNEIACSEKFKDFSYRGEVKEVVVTNEQPTLTIDLGCSSIGMLGCDIHAFIYCQNRASRDFSQKIKDIRKGDVVEVKGIPSEFTPRFPIDRSTILTKCEVMKVK